MYHKQRAVKYQLLFLASRVSSILVNYLQVIFGFLCVYYYNNYDYYNYFHSCDLKEMALAKSKKHKWLQRIFIWSIILVTAYSIFLYAAIMQAKIDFTRRYRGKNFQIKDFSFHYGLTLYAVGKITGKYTPYSWSFFERYRNLYDRDMSYILNFPEVNSLRLSWTVTQIPTQISKLKNLQNLHIYRDKENISAIYDLLSTQSLLFRGMKQLHLQELISQLHSLQKLEIDRCDVNKIPLSITDLKKLSSLEIRHSNFKIFPAHLLQISSLKTLRATRCKFSKMPSQISNDSQLKYLNMKDNAILEIPSSIGKLNNLERLILESNQISHVPKEIAQATKLWKLDLGSNKLSVFSQEITSLPNLMHLYINRNSIVEIPEQIAQLSKLYTLNLAKNQIQEIPASIGKLQNLHVLHLWENKIEKLPPEIGELTNLEELNLAYNNLSEIPPQIGNLTNLRSLDVAGNKIAKFPQEISKLKNLSTLRYSVVNDEQRARIRKLLPHVDILDWY